jgi:hypothetical protein
MKKFMSVCWKVIGGVTILLCGYVTQTFACTCVAEPLSQAVSRADYIFLGTVLLRQDPPPNPSGVMSSMDPVYFHVAVERTLKGELPSPAIVVTARESASCGYPFQRGTRYLIFGYRATGTSGGPAPAESTLSTTLCSQTTDKDVDGVATQVKALLAQRNAANAGSTPRLLQ